MLERLKNIFSKVLDTDAALITERTTIDNLSEWDSMKHLELIMEIEKEFNVEFAPHEIILMNTVERIMDKLKSKGVQAA